ncbi:LysR family transcriptional regulator [Parafrigoribacterium soli]|uniref:LysR family transcriptional regulator n=1 Tax=Parafrigoribacterium soli TaxID=3144663 RepID=UPI0032EF15B5
MNLDLFRLLVFVAVVDRNGYSAAARHLHLSQSTVSHHVGELQKGLQAELLVYEQGTIHLTAAGREVYRSALLMLTEQDSLEHALDDLKRGRGGRVRLGASLAFEQEYFLDQAIAPFLRSHPQTMLSLRFGHSGSTAQAVLDRQLDLAYVIDWHLPADAQFELLHTAELMFFVAKDHPLAAKESVAPEEVAEVGLITAPATSSESVYYLEKLRESGMRGDNSVLEVDGLQARMLAANAGLGVVATFVPKYAHTSTLTGALVPVRLDRPTARAEIGLVQRVGDNGSETVAAVAAWLRDLSSTK